MSRRTVRILVWGVLIAVLMCFTPPGVWFVLFVLPLYWYGWRTARRDDQIQDEFNRMVENYRLERE